MWRINLCSVAAAIFLFPGWMSARGQWVPVDGLGVAVRSGFRVGVHAPPDLAGAVDVMVVDSRGNLVVAGEGSIRTLFDTDQDGVADVAVRFASLRIPARGLCADQGRLLVADDEGVKVYTDSNGDGAADGAPVPWLELGTGPLGFRSVILGPDGWVYASGGLTSGVGESQADSSFSPLRLPQAGAVIRRSLDGARTEIVADGFRDPVDMAFNGFGDAIVADGEVAEDWLLPWHVPSRLFQLAVGGDHGTLPGGGMAAGLARPVYAPETVVGLANLGRGGVSGVEVYRHYQFPEAYRGGMFVADRNQGRVFYYALRPTGSTYTAVTEVFMQSIGRSGFSPTDLAVAPDGCLLVASGGQGIRGGVLRVQFLDRDHVVNATNWIQTSLTEYDAAMIAPQPMSAWSRDFWEPVLGRTPPAVMDQAAADETFVANLRLRAIDALTELHGGLSFAAATAAALASAPEVRARVAWSLGRSPCINCLPVLLGLTADSSPYVRRHALDAVADRAAGLDPAALQQAIAANLGHPDRRVRHGVERVIAALPQPAFDALWARLKPGNMQGRLLGLSGLIRRHRGDWPIEEAVETGLDVLRRSLNPQDRLEAARWVVMGLGGHRVRSDQPAGFASYESAADLRPHTNLTRRVQTAVGALFPTRNPPLDMELARLLAMIEADDPSLPGKMVAQVDARSTASSDFHYLMVLSRLKGARTAPVTEATARALLGLERKAGPAAVLPNQHWTDRWTDLARALLARDAALGPALLIRPDLASSTHAGLVSLLGPEHFLPVVRRFFEAAKLGEGWVWTSDLAELFATLPVEEVRGMVRSQWRHGVLRPILMAKLGEAPEEADREKFLWAMEASDVALARTGMSALMKLGADPSGSTLLASARLLRRLMGNPEESLARAQVLKLIALHGGATLAIQETGAADRARLAELYRPVWDWLASAHSGILGRMDQRDRAQDNLWRGRLNGVRWEEGDASRGAAVFEQRGCARCHWQEDPLGPALRTEGAGRSPYEILEPVLFPNREVEERWRVTVIETSDRRVFNGIVVHETPEVVLMAGLDGVMIRIGMGEVTGRYRGELSAMPAGLLDGASPRDLADLRAFLGGR